jgi:4-hydroxy-tetrahydrodipicolinate reductase
MKIAMIGYGKMGKTIEKLANEMGHELVLKIGSQNVSELTIENLKQADVAIEFSIPSTAFGNLKKCIDAGVPVVCGTTAWLDQYEELVSYCKIKKGTFLYASNFSIGVNIFFKLNQYLAKMMEQFGEYQVAIEEIHHTQKLDAPSGTAVTLTKDILQENKRYATYKLQENNQVVDKQVIPVVAKRLDKVPGTHTIDYTSDIDTIQISHVAHNRIGFAQGAIKAAEWVQNKEGVFDMQDMLGLE